METASNPSILEASIPHSSPACMASTLGSLPYISLNASFINSRSGESTLYFQPGYTPDTVTVPFKSAVTLFKVLMTSSFALVVSLLTKNCAHRLSSSFFRIPRLREVSTSPGILSFILITPFGTEHRKSAVLRGSLPLASLSLLNSRSIRISGSVTEYSSFISEARSFIRSLTLLSYTEGRKIVILQSVGMALSAVPPFISPSRHLLSVTSFAAHSKRPAILQALALYLFIISPE